MKNGGVHGLFLLAIFYLLAHVTLQNILNLIKPLVRKSLILWHVHANIR